MSDIIKEKMYGAEFREAVTGNNRNLSYISVDCYNMSGHELVYTNKYGFHLVDPLYKNRIQQSFTITRYINSGRGPEPFTEIHNVEDFENPFTKKVEREVEKLVAKIAILEKNIELLTSKIG